MVVVLVNNLREKKVAQEIIGLAPTGSFKGFVVISDCRNRRYSKELYIIALCFFSQIA
jgi:hypothetical protein